MEPADDELQKAIEYHGQQSELVGERFAEAYREALQRVLEQPEAWPIVSKNTRCCRLKKFKYGILYQVRTDEIVIVAIMHLHRKPGYWNRRV